MTQIVVLISENLYSLLFSNYELIREWRVKPGVVVFNPSAQISVSSRSLGSSHPGTVAGHLWTILLLVPGAPPTRGGVGAVQIFRPDPGAGEPSRYSREVAMLCFAMKRTGQYPRTFLK